MLGVAISAGAAVEDTPEFKSVESDLASAKSDLAATASSLADAEAEIEPMKAKVAETDAREKALDTREADISTKEKNLVAAAASVKKREQAVGIAETEMKNNTIPGDGIFEVGKDIKAGTYKTKGGTPCYYAVLRDVTGSLGSIVDNNNIDGPGILKVSKGQYLELSGCAEWVKQ